MSGMSGRQPSALSWIKSPYQPEADGSYDLYLDMHGEARYCSSNPKKLANDFFFFKQVLKLQ
jgi:hypothetical protein